MATCGHCRQVGMTVEHVRNCSRNESRVMTMERPAPAAAPRPTTELWHNPARTPRPRIEMPRIPESKYAIEDSQGVLRFYKVDAPQKGKWAGRIFVKGLIGAPGAWREIKLNFAVQAEVARIIAQDPHAAALMYSRKFTRCAACESPLSDKDSRERGFGPVCITRYGR